MNFKVVFVSIFLLSCLAPAQEHPSVAAQPNSVYTAADGKFEAAPDTVVLEFKVSVQEETPQAAYQHSSKEVEQVRQVLRANGIEPKSANIGFMAVQPVYEPRSQRQKVIGYLVVTDVKLKLKDFSKVGPITQQLADANASESQSLNYTLENMDEAKNKAVEDAYRRARASAETIARASGRTLGDLSYASVDTYDVQPIRPRLGVAMAAKAAAAISAPNEEFTPQNVTVTAHVNALFTLK
jgi:uncharacterized protein